MNRKWKSFILVASLSVNVAILAGYVYGAVNPRIVQGSPRVIPPGLRDPNLTEAQVQAIREIQTSRKEWFAQWEQKYRKQMLDVIDLIDNRNPDWAAVNGGIDHLRKLRGEYHDIQVHGWSDINLVLTPEQGHQYLQAIRDDVLSSDHTRASRVR